MASKRSMKTRLYQVIPSALLGLCLASVLAQASDNSAVSSRPDEPYASSRGVFADVPLLTTNLAGTPPAEVSGSVQATTGVRVSTTRNMASLNEKQKLGVADKISYRVVEDQEDAKVLTVTDAGELDVPELGLVTATGKGCKELAYEIKAKLEQTTYYHATVIIGLAEQGKGPSGRRVYVTGEVQRPGMQEIPGGETSTVSKAIMRAFGFTNYGDKKRVRVIRSGAKGTPGRTFTVNVADILEKGRTDQDVAVEPEDLIYVPARAINIY